MKRMNEMNKWITSNKIYQKDEFWSDLTVEKYNDKWNERMNEINEWMNELMND